MTTSHLLTGVLALSFLTAGVALSATGGNQDGKLAVINTQNSHMMQNEYVSVEVLCAGRKLVGVTVTDKINGLSYDLGEDVFDLQVCDEATDEACSKKEYKDSFHKISAANLTIGAPKTEDIAAKPNARRLVERKAGKRISIPFVVTLEGHDITWWAELREGQPYVRVGLDVTPRQFAMPARKISLLKLSAPEARTEGSIKGSPVVAAGNRLFAGVELPYSSNEATEDGICCSVERSSNLPRQATSSFSAVLGFCAPTQLRRTFQLAYVNSERARAYEPFLNYNTWYDIGYFTRYNEKEAMDTVRLFGEELVKKRGVQMDSFLMDDGWDNTETLWEFHDGLPHEFRNLRKLAESYHSAPGVWFSPWGGYGQPKINRIEAAKGKFETNERGFALSGPVYYKRFRDMCLHMIRENGVNHFKFDGTSGQMPAAEGSQFGSDFEAIMQLIRDLRQERPDIYINLTTGTWASPFWFGIADSIWRGDMDHDFCGEGSPRNQWITFRDAHIYAHNVKPAPLFPINSLMTHGVIYNKGAHGLTTTSGDDLSNEIWSGFGLGTQMQELYITPSMLKPEEWDTLAAAAKWTRANAETLVDSHWIGGDPAKSAVYGFASWSPVKGIVTLRNPAAVEQSFSFDISSLFELPVGAPVKYSVVSPKGDKLPFQTLEAGKPATLKLAPFEVVVFEAIPEKN